MNEFYKKITEWLLPLGYVEVFRSHPCAEIKEWHFAKNGVRVICVGSHDKYCYLYSDILKQPHCLALRTSNFKIGTEKLEELQEYMEKNSEILKKGK